MATSLPLLSFLKTHFCIGIPDKQSQQWSNGSVFMIVAEMPSFECGKEVCPDQLGTKDAIKHWVSIFSLWVQEMYLIPTPFPSSEKLRKALLNFGGNQRLPKEIDVRICLTNACPLCPSQSPSWGKLSNTQAVTPAQQVLANGKECNWISSLEAGINSPEYVEPIRHC